jgi:hypothetical protein
LGNTLIRAKRRSSSRNFLSPLLMPDHSLCKDGHVKPATFCQCPVCDPSIHVSKKLLKRGSIVHEKVDAIKEGCYNHPTDNVPELASASFSQSSASHCHIVINRNYSSLHPPHPLHLPNRRLHRDILSLTNNQAVVHPTLPVLSSDLRAGTSILHRVSTQRPSRGRSNRHSILRLDATQMISNQDVGSRLEFFPRISVDGLIMLKPRS